MLVLIVWDCKTLNLIIRSLKFIVRESASLKEALRSFIKISLTFMFWFVINEVVSFLFGNRLPPIPNVENPSVIFLYPLIFIVEFILSCLLTYSVSWIIHTTPNLDMNNPISSAILDFWQSCYFFPFKTSLRDEKKHWVWLLLCFWAY